MSAPRVSVVMPVRDGRPYVREAVASILGQTIASLELIVIDDGSLDGTAEVVAEAARQDARLRLFRRPREGVLAALELGCREARAEYVARMDADDVALPERIERQADFLDSHPDVLLVGSACAIIDAEGAEIRTARYPASDEAIRRELWRYNCIVHPTAVFRRSAYLAAGGYRTPAAEDYDLWLRLSERGRLANLREPLLAYRHHGAKESVEYARHQALWVLAARLAARRRQAGLPDPLDGLSELTPEVLEDLGLPRREIDRAVLAQYLHWAAILVESGDREAGRRMTARLSELDLSLGRRELRSRAALERGNAALRAGRRARAAGFLALAIGLAPLRSASDLAVAAGRAFASRRTRGAG
jgi:GT2 family glycosyltransferase